jgi:hypothetical protein
MNSTRNPPDSAPEPHFVREGGVPYQASENADPFEAWMSLMEAVEALCPRWPERAQTIGADYRL